MEIYTLRHATTLLNIQKKVNGQLNEPLAPEGIRETKDAIPLIPDTIKQIYSSSLLRARQTAEIFGNELQIPVSAQSALSEIHMGSLAGNAWEEMENGSALKEKHRTASFDYRPFGGESVDDVLKRLVPFFKEINTKHKDKEVLIITHGGMIRLIKMLETGNTIYETEQHVTPFITNLDKIIKNFEEYK